ncbi:fused DSP-PTPase phosphatase/NAD kinase-like protein [Hydrogenimonas sp.]
MSHKKSVRYETLWDKIKAWFTSMIIEHNFTNIFRLNLHKVDDNLYRSSQPTPWQLKRIVKEKGIKTVINLRGTHPESPVYMLEKKTCEELGVKMIDIEIYSRAIPERKRLEKMARAFEEAEYPALMHCKAGADRTGLAATFYLYHKEGIPLEKIDQLKFIPYGHIKSSNAGIIDYYFEEFAKYEKEHPGADILEWTEKLPREEMKKAFRAQKESYLSDFINNVLLRRE